MKATFETPFDWVQDEHSDRFLIKGPSLTLDVRLPGPWRNELAPFVHLLKQLLPESEPNAAVAKTVRLCIEEQVSREKRRAWLETNAGLPTSGTLAELPANEFTSPFVVPRLALFGLRWPDDSFFLGLQESRQCAAFVGVTPHPKVTWYLRYLLASFFVNESHVFPLHASTIEYKKKQIALVGQSGSGKTSLALAACRGSAHLITEDITYVDSSWRFLPITLRDFVTLRDGTKSMLGSQDGVSAGSDARAEAFFRGKQAQSRHRVEELVGGKLRAYSSPRHLDRLVFPRLAPERTGWELQLASASPSDAFAETKYTSWLHEELLGSPPVIRYPILSSAPTVIRLETDLHYDSDMERILEEIAGFV